VRTCSVPEGNSLFFPVINFVNFYSPQCPPLTGKTVKELRDYIQPFIKGIHDVSVTLGRNSSFGGEHGKVGYRRRAAGAPGWASGSAWSVWCVASLIISAYPTHNIF
jgi:hypothetical protein